MPYAVTIRDEYADPTVTHSVLAIVDTMAEAVQVIKDNLSAAQEVATEAGEDPFEAAELDDYRIHYVK